MFAMASWLTLGATGCDERPVPPAALIEAAASKERGESPDKPFDPPISGPRVRSSLIAFPISAELPPGWRVSNDAGRTILRGHTPFSRNKDDELEIMMTARERIKDSTLKQTVKDYEAVDAKSDRLSVKYTERDGMRVLETIELEEASTTQNAATLPIVTVQMTYRFYVAGEGLDLNEYEFNIANMTGARLEKDREFVRTIFDSFSLDPSP
jgi:hypothetical protein